MVPYTPHRFRKNVPGPFYTTGDCLACDAPEHEAPDLLAPLTGDNYDTYFVRQPVTPDEVERACRALEVCCAAALRYGGTDPNIIAGLVMNLIIAFSCCRVDQSLVPIGWRNSWRRWPNR